MTLEEKQYCDDYLELLEIEGKPAIQSLTPGQYEIFYNIVIRPKKRVIILCSTQYGKSLITALAAIVVATQQGEVVSIVAPTNEKAKIIMRYFIEHLGDDQLFYHQLEKNTKLERLRQEESKERIIFKNGGGIFVVSVQAGNAKKTVEAAMGLGSAICIQDESGLIPDETEATIFRMIAGKGKDAFYCKLGNPFYRTSPYTHFYDSWVDPEYAKVFIDYERGIEEGRYTQKFIEEARKKPLFDVLYGCKFPDEDMMDKKGWMPLLSHKEVEIAMEGAQDLNIFGEKVFGADPADSGQDEAVAVVRGANLAKIAFASANINIMEFVGTSKIIIDDEKIKSNNVHADSIGLGAGYVQRLRELGQAVDAVNVAETAIDQRNFVNKKAENYWRARRWIKDGGKLHPDERWYQLCDIKYRARESDGRMEIMSKQDMRKMGISSPDIAEAFMLTFSAPVRIFQPSYEDKHFKMLMDRKKARQSKRVY